MKHFITLSLTALALAWAMPGQAQNSQQNSPAPEAASGATTHSGDAADTGITGNDGSEPGSDGAGSRSDDTTTPDYEERKPTGRETGDKDDFTGNEGTDTESTGTGTGHGSANKDGDTSKQTRDSGGTGHSN